MFKNCSVFYTFLRDAYNKLYFSDSIDDTEKTTLFINVC